MSWMWLVTAASLTGVVLNIYKHPMCFAVWCGTNLAWMMYDISLGAYAQAAMFFVYLVTSVWGLWKWTREAREKRRVRQINQKYMENWQAWTKRVDEMASTPIFPITRYMEYPRQHGRTERSKYGNTE